MKYNSILRNQRLSNHEGSEAWTMTPEMDLYTAVVTTSLSPMTYEGKDERADRISRLVGQCDPMFVARLAVYARTQMYLRSVPLLLVVELAKRHNGDNLVSRTVSQIVLRADEIMELLACYVWRNSSKNEMNQRKQLSRLSRQIQNGLQLAFNNFDEYQFAKYDNHCGAIKLRDALFMVHPKAKNTEQQAIFNKIASQSLATPYTWETEMSVLGQQKFESEQAKANASAEKWSELILSGHIGYMALLRNLSNILKYSIVSEQAMMSLVSKISDRQSVIESRQLPFRFLSAYNEIRSIDSSWTPLLMQALEAAVRHSAANITSFDAGTRVVLASDTSGSMRMRVSPKSTIMLYDIGLMLSMLLKSRCGNVIAGMFGDIWKTINLPSENILANVQNLRSREGEVGYSTNGHLVLEDLVNRKVVVDKIMLFTDMQLWNSTGSGVSLKSAWHEYRSMVSRHAKLYIFDLAGYGQAPISLAEPNVYLIAGWSDKIFDVLAAIEHGATTLDQINKIVI